MDAKHIRVWPALIGAVVALGACSGNRPLSGALGHNDFGTRARHHHHSRHGGCQQGDIGVHPCRIRFDSDNRGPTDVTVRRQSNKAQVSERDDCATRRVATIARQGDRRYRVTAGASKGSCSAHFGDGGEGTGGKLKIVNDL